jgi:hypothetical protein
MSYQFYKLQAIQQINRDMNMMQFYLRPLKAAVSQLMHDLPEANDVELRRHLEDLLDHVVVRKQHIQTHILHDEHWHANKSSYNTIVGFSMSRV